MSDVIEIEPSQLASKFINHTNKNIFLTGKAGTGKTTFLKNIIQQTHKKAVIVAPTGIAAINAGGVTIHSLFQLPFGNFIPVNDSSALANPQLKITSPALLIRNMQMSGSKRNLLRELELLIIDEVSMLRADLLDAIDTTLRYIRRQHNKTFGGVQVLFIGDLLQLPPVIKDEEWDVLKAYYNSIYFFDAKVLGEEKPVYIELEKIYRQADNTFILLLNNLRNNRITEKDATLLNTYYKPSFKAASTENYITLTTHNYKADRLNKEYLQNLRSKSHFFEARIEGEFSEYTYPVEKTLELKQGSQIMFVKNDPTGMQRFFNGKIGVISSLSDNEIQVTFENSTGTISVEPYQWQNIKYRINEINNEIEENIHGTFTQYPIKLAWAITVHKSQGLTFDKAIIDIGDAFAPGQIYVALSRLRSLKGLVLSSTINLQQIEQDIKINEFSKTKSEQSSLATLIEKEETQFLKSYLTACFNFTPQLNNLYDYIDSFEKDEKKSDQQHHKAWAVELKNSLATIKPHADKFLLQLTSILSEGEKKQLELLDNRVKAASAYFTPLFKKMSSTIIAQLEVIKREGQNKPFIKELLELETQCYEQIKRMQKAVVLTEVLVKKKEFTKQAIHHIVNDSSRIDYINNILASTSQRKKRTKKEVLKKGNTESNPIEKVDSKEISFQLFKQNKSIEEIAQLRSLAFSTIEGHLAQYVSKGELDARHFVSEEKIEHIIIAAKSIDSFKLGAIKSLLGDEYSYTDIRFAIASHFANEAQKEEA